MIFTMTDEKENIKQFASIKLWTKLGKPATEILKTLCQTFGKHSLF